MITDLKSYLQWVMKDLGIRRSDSDDSLNNQIYELGGLIIPGLIRTIYIAICIG